MLKRMFNSTFVGRAGRVPPCKWGGKRMRVPLPVAGAFAVLLTWASQAGAATYNWTYNDNYHSGSGTLTTTDGSSPFTITAIAGTFDGSSTLQLLDPGSCCQIPQSAANNNLLYYPATSTTTLLDGSGLGFENFAPNSFQIFFNGTY